VKPVIIYIYYFMLCSRCCSLVDGLVGSVVFLRNTWQKCKSNVRSIYF
jgi:hypothetical protein